MNKRILSILFNTLCLALAVPCVNAQGHEQEKLPNKGALESSKCLFKKIKNKKITVDNYGSVEELIGAVVSLRESKGFLKMSRQLSKKGFKEDNASVNVAKFLTKAAIKCYDIIEPFCRKIMLSKELTEERSRAFKDTKSIKIICWINLGFEYMQEKSTNKYEYMGAKRIVKEELSKRKPFKRKPSKKSLFDKIKSGNKTVGHYTNGKKVDVGRLLKDVEQLKKSKKFNKIDKGIEKRVAKFIAYAFILSGKNDVEGTLSVFDFDYGENEVLKAYLLKGAELRIAFMNSPAAKKLTVGQRKTYEYFTNAIVDYVANAKTSYDPTVLMKFSFNEKEEGLKLFEDIKSGKKTVEHYVNGKKVDSLSLLEVIKLLKNVVNEFYKLNVEIEERVAKFITEAFILCGENDVEGTSSVFDFDCGKNEGLKAYLQKGLELRKEFMRLSGVVFRSRDDQERKYKRDTYKIVVYLANAKRVKYDTNKAPERKKVNVSYTSCC
jgi:hypothetical protein